MVRHLRTASTGTGKTLSFLIPMIEKMDATSFPRQGQARPIRSLILLPTRELAMQVLEHYSSSFPSPEATRFWSSVPQRKHQLDQLSRGPRLVVATPGRLEDFLRRAPSTSARSKCSSR